MNTIWFPDLSNTDGPKYLALTEAIRKAIVSTQLKTGEKLPPVRELGWQLKVTPGTVARAYSKLTDEGLLNAAVGRGTFVAKSKAELSDIPVPIAIDTRYDTQKPDRIDLRSPLLPDVGQEALIRRSYGQLSQTPGPDLLRYPSQDTEFAARKVALDWLNSTDLGPVDVDDIVLAHGGQNAIMLILQCVLKGPNPYIFAEDLSYAGIRHGARLLRAKVVGLKCDGGGVRPDALEAACRKFGPQVFCTSPEVHNPTVGHTGLARRQELADVARRYNCQILEDDCYRIKHSGLASYRELLPELGWYVTSPSKSLTPALRIGFALAPMGKSQMLRRAAQYNYFGVSVPVCDLVTLVLGAPEADNLSEAITCQVNEYVRAAVNALGRFDLKWREDVPFFWLKLPRGWRAGTFCRAAEKQGVLLRSADDFALIDGRAPHAVRIAVNGQIALKHFAGAMAVLEHLLSNPPDCIEV